MFFIVIWNYIKYLYRVRLLQKGSSQFFYPNLCKLILLFDIDKNSAFTYSGQNFTKFLQITKTPKILQDASMHTNTVMYVKCDKQLRHTVCNSQCLIYDLQRPFNCSISSHERHTDVTQKNNYLQYFRLKSNIGEFF